MIYILGKDYVVENCSVEEAIVMASTNIRDILDYIYENVKTYDLWNHTIVILPENDSVCSAEFVPKEEMYDRFIRYTPSFFLWEENEDERVLVEEEMYDYCNKIKLKIEKEREESERVRKLKQEQQERKLYEELKAKYGE